MPIQDLRNGFYYPGLWIDENFDLLNLKVPGVNSSPGNIIIPGTGIAVAAFDGATQIEEVNLTKELNHDYKEGTILKPHLHWYATETTIANVKWQLEYFVTLIGQSNITGTLSAVVPTPGIAFQQIFTDFPILDLGFLKKISAQIHLRLFRDPTDAQDTYGFDAAVATFGYHYLTNSGGSRGVTVK